MSYETMSKEELRGLRDAAMARLEKATSSEETCAAALILIAGELRYMNDHLVKHPEGGQEG